MVALEQKYVCWAALREYKVEVSENEAGQGVALPPPWPRPHRCSR